LLSFLDPFCSEFKKRQKAALVAKQREEKKVRPCIDVFQLN
jgi:hypothetical protein